MAEKLGSGRSSENDATFRRRLVRELTEEAKVRSAESREIVKDSAALCALTEKYLGQRPTEDDPLFAAMNQAYDTTVDQHRRMKQAVDILRGDGITQR